MLRRLEAIILFSKPAAVSAALPALMERGFDVTELHEFIDPYGPTVWVKAEITSPMSDDELFDLVDKITWPLGGCIDEAGCASKLRCRQPKLSWSRANSFGRVLKSRRNCLR
jgi:hypothetical protein